jgi:hypothetical protein
MTLQWHWHPAKGLLFRNSTTIYPDFGFEERLKKTKFLKDINSLIFNNFKDGSISENLKSS